MGIPLLAVVIPTLMILLRWICEFWEICFGCSSGVEAAITTIPLNVFLPSSVHMLWSTLSATHWVTLLGYFGRTSSKFDVTMEFCLNLVTSSQEMEYPRWKGLLINHLDPNVWSSSTPNPNSKGGIIDRVLAARSKHWPLAALFTVDFTIDCRNICNIEGNWWHTASPSRMSSFDGRSPYCVTFLKFGL